MNFSAQLWIILLLVVQVCCSSHLSKSSRETNLLNFIRLLVMRLVYGFASMLGFADPISEVAGGALVPPGVEDDYDGGLDDYDRDYYVSDYD